jgi:glutamyl-tRNA synthetase
METCAPISNVSSDPKVVRFAPSPTGALHIGGARTALYNWLAARGSGGRLILRIEDTDRERSTPENVEQILDALRWLELDWDEGPVSQFDRRERHADAITRLVAAGHAYPDPATGDEVKAWKAEHGNRGYRGDARDEPGAAIRLRVPDVDATTVADLLRGEIAFPNEAQDDFVIARGDGTPLYNLAVAVDDADMGITDVIRGDDHLSNTPKQVMVLAALGSEPPRYAHLPLLHGPDGRKLSKRHGAASVQELRDAGYLPAAVRNYLALLGWGTDDDTTLMSTEELLDRFDVARVGRASAIFDERKLRWVNGRHMRELSLDAYTAALAGYLRATGTEPPDDADRFRAACAIAQDKAQTLAEVWPLVRFVFEPPVDDERARAKFTGPDALPLIGQARTLLAECEPFTAEAIEGALTGLLERSGATPKQLYQGIRVAITGTTVSPGIFDSIAALGRRETLARLNSVLARDPG